MWAGNWLWPVILGALVVAGLGGYVTGRRSEANAQAAALLKETRRAQAAELALRKKTLEIDVNDNVARTALDQRLIVNLSSPQPIRVCQPATGASPSAGAPSEHDGVRDDGHDVPFGKDIGPALLVYARDCERTRQKLTALQKWAAAVAK